MNVQDSAKNKLGRSEVLHDYWSPLNWIYDKPEKIENAKIQNGKTCKGKKNEIREEIKLEVKRLEDEMEQLLGEFETINSAANAKLDGIKEQYIHDDTGIVDTGDRAERCGKIGSHRRNIKKCFYITRQINTET